MTEVEVGFGHGDAPIVTDAGEFHAKHLDGLIHFSIGLFDNLIRFHDTPHWHRKTGIDPAGWDVRLAILRPVRTGRTV